MKRVIRIGLLAGIILSLVAPLAVAADTIEGRGALQARGVGVVTMEGRGWIDIEPAGPVTVWVAPGAEIVARGRGVRRELPGGATLLAGWRGDVHIRGDALDLTIAGAGIRLAAAGEGTVTLRGRGAYRTRTASGEWQRGDWSPDGHDVALME